MTAHRRLHGSFRLLVVSAVAACLAGGALPAVARQVAPSPAASAPILHGLDFASSGQCAGAFQISGTELCTHGADPIPRSIRERGGPQPMPPLALEETNGVGCDGDGTSGKRVQALYAYVASRQNRRAAYLGSFRGWAANVDAMFRDSAAETSGSRRLRWATNDCLLSVPAVAVSAAAETDFAALIHDLNELGYDRDDRKYLVWFDTNPSRSPICGIASMWLDDRPALNNSDLYRGYARVDYACWNWSEAHEIMHTLGAVQRSAPHASAGLHCTDEYDQMCYQDGSGVVMSYPCPARYERLFDCGHDDYFSTSVAPSTYLASHWNTANSSWLIGAPPTGDATAPVVEAPAASIVAGQTLTTTARVRVEWPASSDESGIAAYELQRRKGSGSWIYVPLAPPTATSTEVDIALGATHTFRLRATDGAGNVGAWATAPAAVLRQLEETAPEISYTDLFKRRALASASGGYVRKTAASGQMATLTFSGASVAWVTTTAADRGIAQVRIDNGEWQVVDLYGPALQARRVMLAAGLAPGEQTLEVGVTGERNSGATSARVDIDAFVIWAPVP